MELDTYVVVYDSLIDTDIHRLTVS